MTATQDGGIINMTSITGFNEKKESPAIFFSGISVNADEYRYIKIEMKTDIAGEDKAMAHGFYFSTESAPTFSEGKKVSVAITPKTDDYVEYTFDMAKNSEWYGKVTGIFYSFGGDVTGSASIRSIKFVKGDPIKKIDSHC